MVDTIDRKSALDTLKIHNDAKYNLQVATVKQLREKGVFVFMCGRIGKNATMLYHKYKFSGFYPGSPDLIAIYEGQVCFIFVCPGSVVKDTQKKMIECLRVRGLNAETITNYYGIGRWLRMYVTKNYTEKVKDYRRFFKKIQ